MWWLICLIVGHKPEGWVWTWPASKRQKVRAKRKRFKKCARCSVEV